MTYTTMLLAPQLQDLNDLISMYDLKSDKTVRAMHQKKHLGLLMIRAAEQGNVDLMEDCYAHTINGQFKDIGWSTRLSCAALSLMNKNLELFHYLMEDIHEYSASQCFYALMNAASQALDLSLFDQTWQYVHKHKINIKMRNDVNFLYILAGRNDADRLTIFHDFFGKSSSYKIIGIYAIYNNAKDVVERVMLKTDYELYNHLAWLKACVDLHSTQRHEMLTAIFNSIPTANRPHFLVEFLNQDDVEIQRFADFTIDVAPYFDCLTAQQKRHVIHTIEHSAEISNESVDLFKSRWERNAINNAIGKDIAKAGSARKI